MGPGLTRWTAADISPQAGKLALITGANSGIGFHAALELARTGCSVILACRDTAKAEAAQARILASVRAASVEVLRLDLASLDSVHAAADAFLATRRPLNILINNAGVMALPHRQLTRDGFEMQFGTNHLGHFALTGLLLPALLAGNGRGESRVVTVSSIAHRGATMDFTNLQWEHNYQPWPAYRRSKLANLLFAFELGRRLQIENAPVISVAVHPGVSSTNLFAAGPGQGGGLLAKIVPLFIRVVAQSEERGALPTLFAATASEVQEDQYYGPSGFGEMRGYPVLVRAEIQAYDESLADRLWRVSEELTGVRYPLRRPVGRPA